MSHTFLQKVSAGEIITLALVRPVLSEAACSDRSPLVKGNAT